MRRGVLNLSGTGEDDRYTIDGGNDRPENLAWVRQLLGEGDHKPWECVGTPDEVTAALWLASRRHTDDDLPALRWFAEEVAPSLADPEELVRRELAVSPYHHLPPDWADVLHRYLEAH